MTLTRLADGFGLKDTLPALPDTPQRMVLPFPCKKGIKQLHQYYYPYEYFNSDILKCQVLDTKVYISIITVYGWKIIKAHRQLNEKYAATASLSFRDRG